ncbi:SAM-dependent methyltransferase [Taibaiella koreensis]|uniref:SAM-dependent methyltransferase n=1 Tax=Taibaiella koreensis TaxID=1268548 RepID=UPI000E59BBA3|nr:class I SAM-dependent methyltransferase [Taibaiella koreensis]
MATTRQQQDRNKWDERYRQQDFAYGKAPNHFFASCLEQLAPGSILMPADGEGRNGVYAATRGWKVHSFDLSSEGQAKALQLAAEKGVSIAYQVSDGTDLGWDEASFDAIGAIYAHVAPEQIPAFYRRLDRYLKPGGTFIFEAFGKAHLQWKALDPRVGGPDDIEMLFSEDDMQTLFNRYEIIHCREEVVLLEEGLYHRGKGSVLRFAARKPL